jgi:heme/copper-type cytochrome/quinol oxidase subunit 4
MKIVVIVLLLAVVASLFSGLFFVYRDKGESNRAVVSLTIRIVLSLVVFLVLIGSYFLGLTPSGRL